MAGKSKAQAKAAERQARLEELQKQQAAQERKRNLMVGAVVVLVLVVLGATFFLVSRGGDVEPVAESDYSVTIGPEDAPHQLVVYEDFLCPGCGQFEATTADRLAELAEAGEVRVDYRPFVLLDRLGTYSARATAAFGVVKEESGDEVAKEFHDLLFADQPAEGSEYPEADWLVEKAVQAGADEAAVREGIEAGENDFSRAATEEARDAGVTGTPTLILDGETFTGSYDELFAEIEG
jgi:protein-disulfide isomerase